MLAVRTFFGVHNLYFVYFVLVSVSIPLKVECTFLYLSVDLSCFLFHEMNFIYFIEARVLTQNKLEKVIHLFMVDWQLFLVPFHIFVQNTINYYLLISINFVVMSLFR